MRFIAFCILIVFSLNASTADEKAQVDERDAMVIRYGQVEFGLRKDYQLELLKAVLNETESSDGPYRLNIVTDTDDWSTPRFRKYLRQGRLINVSWGIQGTRGELNHGIMRIPFPIIKGINGYRVLVIRSGDRNKFKSVRDLEDLRNYVAGQGAGWFDINILEHNKITSVESPLHRNMFSMLSHNRFDFVPLGIIEIEGSLNTYGKDYTDLEIENTLLLYYPFPIYFEVSENHPELVDRMTLGMKKVTENGTLDKIFIKHFGEKLNKFVSSERTLIQLENPYYDGEMEKELFDLHLQ